MNAENLAVAERVRRKLRVRTNCHASMLFTRSALYGKAEIIMRKNCFRHVIVTRCSLQRLMNANRLPFLWFHRGFTAIRKNRHYRWQSTKSVNFLQTTICSFILLCLTKTDSVSAKSLFVILPNTLTNTMLKRTIPKTAVVDYPVF